MGELIFIIVIFVAYKLYKFWLDIRVDCYDVSNLDATKMTQDAINGVPLMERKRRMVNGYYDK